MPISNVCLIDNMQYMETLPDKFFELAVVDPPYGIGINKQNLGLGGGFTKHVKEKSYKMGNWDDNIPNDEYFIELFRISKNQIIWGGNYFKLSPTPCYLFWDKKNGTSDFADGELAWTSFKSPVRKFSFLWAGCFQEDMKNKETRIHPTHKPIALYKWILKNYAKPGDKIFDSHMGSQSSRIAAYQMGFDYYGCELDPDYFRDGCKRFDAVIHKRDTQIYEPRNDNSGLLF